MQVPVEWFREYVDFEEPVAEVAEKLTMAGIEVGEIVTERFGYGNSFVSRVVKAQQHEKRPDFYVLTVEGGGRSCTVLSNLREFREGEILPVAFEGFVMPDGTKLEPMKFSGVTSDGKILSEADVEYSDNDGVILPIPENAEVGDCIPDIMKISCEVFKFDLTANRGDCLSVFGIARELAAVLNRPLKKNVFDFELEESPEKVDFSVDIVEPELCPRYSGRVIRDVKITGSPVWMKRRLAACGMRAINSIVDVTNYVMLEAGQPLHAFDLDTLEDRAIVVRRAAKGEKITTIDDEERPLDPFMLVIADKTRPVAVAGVMGGADTEISGGTVNMLLESAHFQPRNLRKTATALGMRTEASIRFEKGVSQDNAVKSSDYASYLIAKQGWGRPLAGMIDEHPLPRKPVTINLDLRRVNNFISPEITDEESHDILKRLDFDVEVTGPGSLEVSAPGHRFDISIWEDLAEEIARIHGYERIPSELPLVRTHRATEAPAMERARLLRRSLTACGLSEIVTFSFTNAGELESVWDNQPPTAVPISNPLTDDHTHLRPSLLPNMLKVIARNKANSPASALHFFELGNIFFDPDEPKQKESLSIGICGQGLSVPAASEYPERPELYFVLKGIIERFFETLSPIRPRFAAADNELFHPGRCAELYIGERKVGEMGEIHPRLCRRFDIREPAAAATLDPEPIGALLERQPRYEHISRHPALSRDLSIIVDEEIPAGDTEDVIRRYASDLLENTYVYDVFRGDKIGDGKKSVTFSLEFRAPDRTLTDEAVNPVMDTIIGKLSEELGGSLRDA